MKKIALCALATSLLALGSCNDFLDESPRDSFENNADFWNNTNLVQNYSNYLYNNYVGYANGGSYGWFYHKSLSDDQVNPSFENWTFTTVPSSSSYWDTNFAYIRHINYMLQNLKTSTLSESVIANYNAIGRLNRAWTYYQLVRMYGDVQWQDEVVTDSDPNGSQSDIIYGERDDRDDVMDKVIEDLDYAIANLSSQSAANAWSKDMALAMKSDICLYEGTYCKYRTATDNGKGQDLSRAQKYLQLCVEASEALMNSGRYQLSAEYGTIYNSLDLSSNKEVIFWRNYEKDIVGHSVVDYTTGSTAQSGISKDAIDAFLFTDGKPLGTTTVETSDKPEMTILRNFVKDSEGVVLKTVDKKDSVRVDTIYTIHNLLANRDKRLSVLIDSVLCFKGHGWARYYGDPADATTAQMTSSTGYTIHKYDNLNLSAPHSLYRNGIGSGYTDGPIYWLAVIYLNEAEAKAELGTLTQSDLDATVNKLRDRAGLPHMTLTPDADPANNHGVSNIIWEVRRERRCELMTDNWFRYFDLVRWHQLDKIGNSNPNIYLGANVSDVKNADVTTDGGYIKPVTNTRSWDKKYYFFPIPSSTITNLPSSMQSSYQNPGW